MSASYFQMVQQNKTLCTPMKREERERKGEKETERAKASVAMFGESR